jgi:ABC-type branched-subunit amino acid transport system substrate-binding protein
MEWRPGRKLVAGAAAATALACGHAGCSTSSSPTPAPDASTAQPTITFGVSDALTGGLAGLGVGVNQAVGVAARQINQVGILGGRQVVLDVRDDTSDPTQARDIVQALLAEGVAGVLGPLSSGQVHNVQDLTYLAKTVEITPSATSTILTIDQPAGDRYLFRTAPSDSFQGRAIVRFVRDGVAPSSDAGEAGMLGGTCRAAFIVNGSDTYGSALGDVVQTTFPSASAQVLGRDPVQTTLQSDYSSTVNDIVTAHPDCLVLVVYSDVAAELLRELGKAIAADTGHDWSKFFVCGSDGEYDAKFIPDGQSDPGDPRSANSAAGCYGTAPDPAPNTPGYAAFKDIWEQSYPGVTPPAYGASIYDAALLLALAIQQAGTASDGTRIRDALRVVATPPGTSFGPAEFVDALNAISKGIDIDYDGASGHCDFDPSGDVKADYVVWQVQKQADGTYAFASLGAIKEADL